MSSLRKTVFTLFFFSGFCGLLYQVVWIRLAFAHFGIITPVLSVVVSVFMLGLSLGSWAAGIWADRLVARRKTSAIKFYALTEALIGIGAFVVPTLFVAGDRLLLPSGEINSAAYLSFSAFVLGLSILPWCILMGATFPLMMAYLKEREPLHQSSFSFLYLANVLGAMCGTILTADVLVELLGFKKTLAVAGVLNFLIAGASLMLARLRPAGRPAAATAHAARALPEPARRERSWIYLILFVTGFTSMALEVIWVRDFTPVLGTTVYAFALIVATYLFATWLGSNAYRRQLERGASLRTAELLAELAVFAVFPILINDPRLGFRQMGVLVGIFPFSFLLGYLTPSLIDRYSQGDPNRAGRAYAVNIVGCILGPLFASYLFLPLFGAKGSMLLMALPYAGLLAVEFRRLNREWRWTFGGATALFLGLSFFFARSYEEQYPGAIVRRDSTATVTSLGSGMNRRLLVNGKGITELTTITKVMAHFPLAVLRDKPVSALNICFGMGTTYRSLLRWEGIQVTAVELVPSVKEAFGYYHEDAAEVVANPRGRIVIDDGRRFLRRTNELFDLVTIDPPPPIEAAGSSLLYAREFYTLMKTRMKPGGILQQWFPGGPGVECEAIARSLQQSFPYIKVYRSIKGWGFHFLASQQPILALSAQQLTARLSPAARKDLLEWEPAMTTRDLFQQVLENETSLESLIGNDPERVISDDRPYNEYYLLRRAAAHYRRTGRL